jgi:1,2-phenylacetyl-CoA epoxidase catalytic subunit
MVTPSLVEEAGHGRLLVSLVEEAGHGRLLVSLVEEAGHGRLLVSLVEEAGHGRLETQPTRGLVSRRRWRASSTHGLSRRR